MFEFDGGGHFRGNKHLITKINCSVVLDLGWGGTHKRTYIQLKIDQEAKADWNIRAFLQGSVLLLSQNSNKEVHT